MRFIKLGILSIVFLFIVVMLISLLIPSHIRISKAINVKADSAGIIKTIADPGSWVNWYPGLDSARPFYLNGSLKGMFTDEQRKAYLMITETKADEVKAEFNTPSLRPVKNGWKTLPGPDSTTVQWYMDFHLRWYPWEKFGSLLLEKTYGAKMEQGLENLKRLLQADRTSNY
jgi:hypothetical protein